MPKLITIMHGRVFGMRHKKVDGALVTELVLYWMKVDLWVG